MLACVHEQLNPPMLRPASIAISIACLASPSLGQADEWSLKVRPKYETLRQNEDWSILLTEPNQDLWDPIKFIGLDDDGTSYASLGGSVRGRFEGWRNFEFGGPTDPDDEFLLSRALLHFDLHVTSYFRFFAEGRTAQASERSLPGGNRPMDVDYLDVQQLFVDISVPVRGLETVTFRPGRQMLSFGNERLISPLDWSNVMRTWDGGSLGATVMGWTVTGFWSVLVETDATGLNEPEEDEQLFGVYATRELGPEDISTDVYWFGNRRDNATYNGTTGNEDRHTFGLRVWGKSRMGFDYEAEAAYQGGSIDDDAIDAYMLSYEMGYQLDSYPTRGWVAFDHASGDDEVGGSVQTFSQLYPDSHDYLGIIDAIGRQNITDGSAGIDWSPLRNLDVRLAGHFFWLANENDALYDATGAIARPGGSAEDRYVGAELDLTATVRTGNHLLWSVGYGHFFTGEALRQSGTSEDVDFLYVSAEYVF